jgi:hypothetical protein
VGSNGRPSQVAESNRGRYGLIGASQPRLPLVPALVRLRQERGVYFLPSNHCSQIPSHPDSAVVAGGGVAPQEKVTKMTKMWRPRRSAHFTAWLE